MRARILLSLASLAFLSACAVGPDFLRPDAPDVTSYDDQAVQKTVSVNTPGGAAQTITTEPLPAEWWKLFQSSPLNGMITQALLRNPDIDAATASLRAAEADLSAGEGYLYPTLGASFTSSRQKVSGASYGGSFPGSIYTLHNASVSVSYGLDLFGGTRRAIEGLEAQRDYQGFELQAARLSVSGNVVTTAIREASLRAQIEATRQLVKEQSRQLDIAQKQFQAGATDKLAVLAEQTDVAQTNATLPPLEQELAETRHALSVLTGDFPTHGPSATFDLASLHLPEVVPLTMPSQLVEQRPDIKAAEANLHAASAAIGVSIANRLPQITLSANIGSVANDIGELFSPGGGIWALTGSASQTLFDAGTLADKEDEAKANFDVAAAMYRKTVLAAFQEVADSLRAIENDARALQAQSEADKSAADSLKLAQVQFHAGAISYVALLDAQNAEQKSRIGLIQAEAQRYADTAALFEALGGSWTQCSDKKETP